MNRLICLFIATVLAWPMQPVLLAQQANQQPSTEVLHIVESMFPKSLRFPQAPEGPYFSCPLVFSTLSSGSPDLIAVAYSGNGAEVDMLKYQPDATQAVGRITGEQLWFTTGDCEIGVVDLSDQEQTSSPLARTIKVSFGGPDWFFTWDGSKLPNVTALSAETYNWRGESVPNSAMYNSDIVDFDRNGPMQIVGSNGDADDLAQDDDGIPSSGSLTLFRFDGMKYVPALQLLAAQEFEPGRTSRRPIRLLCTVSLPPLIS